MHVVLALSFFYNLKKYSEIANLMLAILNIVVTNLGTRCQAHATVRTDLGLLLLCLTEVKDGFDYFRPWVGENLCHSIHKGKGQAGEGSGTAHSQVPDLSMSQSPFQGLPPHQALLEEVPRCLKNQVGQIKPGLKGFCSHLHNLRRFSADHSKTESSINKCLNHIPLYSELELHWCVKPIKGPQVTQCFPNKCV